MLILKHLCNNLITANIHRCYKIHTIPKTLMMQYLRLLTYNYAHSWFPEIFPEAPLPCGLHIERTCKWVQLVHPQK